MTAVEPIRCMKDLRIIEGILKKNIRDFLLFKIGINCGLRISDILALNVIDVKGKDILKITEKKTKKKRRICLNSKLKSIIDKYVINKKDTEPLFVSLKGQARLDRISAYRLLRKAGKKANLNINIGTHTLRKTFGYHYYKKYKDVVMLQKILNHSNPAITLRYIGIEQEEIDNSYRCFEI